MATRGPMLPAYTLSKAALNVNAVCPGWVATWPGTAALGARPVADGAKGVVDVALADDDVSGGFFRDGRALPW